MSKRFVLELLEMLPRLSGSENSWGYRLITMGSRRVVAEVHPLDAEGVEGGKYALELVRAFNNYEGDATYWLIEWPQHPEHAVLHPNAEWLSRGVHDWTVESVRVEKWTKDVHEAVRFPSKEDAEAVIGWLWGPRAGYIATEHKDL